MYLELLNDLLINSSIFQVYFGIIFTVIGVSQLIRLGRYSLNSRYTLTISEQNNLKIDLQYVDIPIIPNESIMIWFIKMFQQVSKPNDDNEDPKSSYFINMLKIRGGIICTKTTYSLHLKHIAF